MKRKLFLFTVLLTMFYILLTGNSCFSQGIAINTTGAKASSSALLDISDSGAVNPKGLLIPRVSLTDVNSYSPLTGSPVTSLLVYSITAPTGGGGAGFYYWDAAHTQWVRLTTDAALSSHNHTIDGLSNVTITSKANNDILQWNGTAWVNKTLTVAGVVTSETDPVVKAINGLVKSDGTTISAAVAGTDYLSPTGSAATLTSFPTLNQNTTGNAATATALQDGRTISITGDLTYTSPSFNGSGNDTAAGTLATVNTNTGSFGSSTAIPAITVNGKGLITAASTNAVIAPAGTLTGTTLASNVVSSSLTSLGTITTGVWNAGAVTSSGAVTGNTIVKTGGTSTQFLKADGSVDANTYMTSSSGVSSITGTANKITASASTGAVTLSLPSAITGLTSVTSTGFTGTLTGNASTALQTARNIFGISFNGTANIGSALGTGAYATIANYAPIASPTFTGTPTAPTAAAGTNNTQIATTAFVRHPYIYTASASETVVYTNPNTYYPATGPYVKYFEVVIPSYFGGTGVFRVKFTTGNHDANGAYAWGRVYVDDVAVGTERNPNGYTEFSEDFTITNCAGRRIQVWGKNTYGVDGNLPIYGFKVCCTTTSTIDPNAW